MVRVGLVQIFAVLSISLLLLYSGCWAANIQGSTIGNDGSTNTLSIAYLVPWSGTWPAGGTLASAILIGIDEIRERQLLPNHEIEWVMTNTQCKASVGVKEAVHGWTLLDDMDFFLGDACSVICQPVSDLAAAFGVPIISWACGSMLLSDKERYPTFTRALGTYAAVGYEYEALAETFGWNRMCVLTTEEALAVTTATFTKDLMEMNGREVFYYLFESTVGEDGVIYEDQMENLGQLMGTLKTKCRIIYTTFYDAVFRHMMMKADEQGMLNGDYVFIGIALEYMYSTYKGSGDYPDDKDEWYNGIVNTGVMQTTNPELTAFQQKVIDRMQDSVFDDGPNGLYGEKRLADDADTSEVSTYASNIHDAVLMWAYGVNKSLEMGYAPDNGYTMTDVIINHIDAFPGIQGSIKVDKNGDYQSNYITEMIHYDQAVRMFEWDSGARQLIRDPGLPEDFEGLVWYGDREGVPPDSPACGWNNEFCEVEEKKSNLILIVGPVVGVLLIVAIIVGILMVRKMNYENALKQVANATIKWADIDFSKESKGKSHTSIISTQSTTGGENRQLFTDIGKYGNERVQVKKLGPINIDLQNRSILIELKDVSSVKHENVNDFIGVCTEMPNCAVLMTYAPKGSIQDVIADDSITLTWDFKISMSNDIASGMQYLHGSSIGAHGYLSSSKCVVDNRWAVKISAYGLPTIRSLGRQYDEKTDFAKSQKKLWVAPEVLKQASGAGGSKESDVYSFGIILSEIVLGTLPYESLEMEASDIVDKVMAGQNPPFRPNIPAASCPDNWKDLMECSWREDPATRIAFSQVLVKLKAINGGKTLNLVDSMINRLEAHTRVLEERVADRSRELEVEKSKVELLLNELLPKSVALALKTGQEVKPETFDNISLFFSDIVGFTTISAKGTPFQVVVMLNNMYTCFDDVASNFDVYKVATIGDAYMVASGCPNRNGEKHAAEIVGMSIGLLEASAAFPIPHIPGEHLRLRIGIHSGPVVAGVAGLKMPRYLLFGDTVDIAARMESGGEAMKIHISQTTEELLSKSGGFNVKFRGETEVKGQGLMKTYWVIPPGANEADF